MKKQNIAMKLATFFVAMFAVSLLSASAFAAPGKKTTVSVKRGSTSVTVTKSSPPRHDYRVPNRRGDHWRRGQGHAFGRHRVCEPVLVRRIVTRPFRRSIVTYHHELPRGCAPYHHTRRR